MHMCHVMARCSADNVVFIKHYFKALFLYNIFRAKKIGNCIQVKTFTFWGQQQTIHMSWSRLVQIQACKNTLINGKGREKRGFRERKNNKQFKNLQKLEKKKNVNLEKG